MTTYIIQTGHFSQAGNFIGYSTKGEKVHIYRKQIFQEFPDVEAIFNCTGQYDTNLMTFPFYCVADHREFDHIDLCGNRTGEKFTRLTAVEISESTLGIVKHAMNDWVLDQMKQLNSTIEKLENDKLDLINDYNELLYQRDPERDTEEIDRLKKENEDLKAQIELGGWDDQLNRVEVEKLNDEIASLKEQLQIECYESYYQQSERERLALIIINARDSFASCNLGLSQEKMDQLINNA